MTDPGAAEDPAPDGPILRIFEVRTKPGCAGALLQKFATTSAGVVLGTPGNRGYFLGRVIEGAGDEVLFVSVWQSLDAVKARFGADWQSSFLPEGYEAMIETCGVRHVALGSGWHVMPDPGAPGEFPD